MSLSALTAAMHSETRALKDILAKVYLKESKQANFLRRKACRIIEEELEGNKSLPDTLGLLLSSVIKSLFHGFRLTALSSTGRINLVSNLPTLARGFVFDSKSDSDEEKAEADRNENPWKVGWAVPLLSCIINSCGRMSPPAQSKKFIEDHLHLFNPPILQLIDQSEAIHKTDGCFLMCLLCETMTNCESDKLKRTKLSGVYAEALQANFMLLPTLTPEDDALMVLKELYPAYRALVKATFVTPLDEKRQWEASFKSPVASHPIQIPPKSSKNNAVTKEAETFERIAMLNVLFRQGLMSSLSHLSAGTPSMEYIALTTFLVSQIRPMVADLGIHTARHLEHLLPLIRHILSNPFVLATPKLLVETLDALEAIIEVCTVRVSEKWWSECLRGLVGCWCHIVDEEDGITKSSIPKKDLVALKSLVKLRVKALQKVVESAFKEETQILLDEDPELEELFKTEK